MSYYDQLLNDSGFMKGISNQVPNSSEAYPHDEFLVRFERNVDARNAHVQEAMQQGKCVGAAAN